MKYISRFMKSAPVLITLCVFFVFCAFATPLAYVRITGSMYDQLRVDAIIFFIAYTYLCFFVAPFLAAQFIYKEKLHNIGVMLPKNNVKNWFFTLAALVMLVSGIIYITSYPSVQHFYSLKNPSWLKFILIQFIALPLYYFAEEFFFRGFFFVILWRKVGWHSFWITDIVFTFAHIAKPIPEILLAIPVSVVLNFLVLKTKSIFPGMLVHYAMGFTLLIFTNYIK